MKTAIIGSRNITLTTTEIAKHVSACEEIVSGGVAGIDTCAAEYARKNGIKLTSIKTAGKQYFFSQVHNGSGGRQHYGCNFLERNNKRWKKTTP